MGRICSHPVLLILTLISWHLEEVEMRALQSGISRSRGEHERGNSGSIIALRPHDATHPKSITKQPEVSTQEYLPSSLESLDKEALQTNMRSSFEDRIKKLTNQENQNSNNEIDGMQKSLDADKAIISLPHILAGISSQSKLVMDNKLNERSVGKEVENHHNQQRNKRSSQNHETKRRMKNIPDNIEAKLISYANQAHNADSTWDDDQSTKVGTWIDSLPDDISNYWDGESNFSKGELFNVVRRKSPDVHRRQAPNIRGRIDPAMRYMGIGK